MELQGIPLLQIALDTPWNCPGGADNQEAEQVSWFRFTTLTDDGRCMELEGAEAHALRLLSSNMPMMEPYTSRLNSAGKRASYMQAFSSSRDSSARLRRSAHVVSNIARAASGSKSAEEVLHTRVLHTIAHALLNPRQQPLQQATTNALNL